MNVEIVKILNGEMVTGEMGLHKPYVGQIVRVQGNKFKVEKHSKYGFVVNLAEHYEFGGQIPFHIKFKNQIKIAAFVVLCAALLATFYYFGSK